MESYAYIIVLSCSLYCHMISFCFLVGYSGFSGLVGWSFRGTQKSQIKMYPHCSYFWKSLTTPKLQLNDQREHQHKAYKDHIQIRWLHENTISKATSKFLLASKPWISASQAQNHLSHAGYPARSTRKDPGPKDKAPKKSTLSAPQRRASPWVSDVSWAVETVAPGDSVDTSCVGYRCIRFHHCISGLPCTPPKFKLLFFLAKIDHLDS